MSSKHAFENLLRDPLELLVFIVAFGFGILCIMHHDWMLLTFKAGVLASIPFFILIGIVMSNRYQISDSRWQKLKAMLGNGRLKDWIIKKSEILNSKY